MIDHETYCKIRLYHRERGLSFAQIARELAIDPETAAKYARADSYSPRRSVKRRSKLDPFKTRISGCWNGILTAPRRSTNVSVRATVTKAA